RCESGAFGRGDKCLKVEGRRRRSGDHRRGATAILLKEGSQLKLQQ
ncbi:hypothetical protein A2U01_0054511, partial [Trifolium medium]|nr:hypothetical protein [Trifolium medium]